MVDPTPLISASEANIESFRAQNMREDETKSFEGRLPQQILTKLEVLDARLQRVEERIEQRSFDTKPIWEQALAQILEVKEEIGTVNRKMDVFSRDVLNLRAEQLSTDERLRGLEERN